MDDDRNGKSSGIFDTRGPVELESGKSRSHLFTKSGVPSDTAGRPYADESYVAEAIGDAETAHTDSPESIRSGVNLPRQDSDIDCVVPTEEMIAPPPPPPRPEPSIPTSQPAPRPMLQGKWRPQISSNARVDPAADIRGNVIIKGNVNIAAGTIISAHEDEPILISSGSAVFEGAVLTILPVMVNGKKVTSRMVKVDGKEYPLFIGVDSVIGPRTQLTGPCFIGDKCFIGAGAHIFWAKVGNGCIIEPGAFVMNVEIPQGYFVPSGMRVTVKENVKKLPKITERYRFRKLGSEMLTEIRGRHY